MLSKRVIPQLLCRGRQLIKGKQFASWRTVGVVAQAVRIFQRRNVDELILLDIGATPEGRGPDLSLIEELAEVCFMPLTVGGGIKTVDDVRAVLRAGADKVAIGSGGPDLIRELSESFGSQAIVGIANYRSIDSPFIISRVLEEHGAGEILLQSIDREGMMTGYDLEAIKTVSQSVNIPVIVSGGCGSYEDMRLAIEAGADAVAAGAFFQFTDSTPGGAAKYLHAAGVEVRL